MPSDDEPAWPLASAAGWSLPGAGPVERLEPVSERYERIGLIGRGGMGVVYAARDRLLDRTVALKEVDPGAATDAVARLEREARLTASLDHPGIVTVHDLGRTADGRSCYAMRLVRGRPLSAFIAESSEMRRRLALVRPFLDACQAVAHAHLRGVVHRDLKPDNIVIGELGETQVIDWGLARTIGEPGGGGGTPAYRSPGQAAGGVAQPADDVYSLGVILAEILGISPTSDALPPGCPPEIAAIAREALRGAYPDARALAADCADWLDGRPVAAHRYTPVELLVRFARAWRGPLWVGALATLVLIGVVAVAYDRNTLARNRAEAAEIATREALNLERDRFASVLAARAMDALGDDRWPEAEVLAARALGLRELPEARGVLTSTMRFGSLPAPELSVPSPCERPIGLGPTGEVICAEPGFARLIYPDGSERRHAIGAGTPFVDERGGLLWVQREDQSGAVYSMEDGRALFSGPPMSGDVWGMSGRWIALGPGGQPTTLAPLDGGAPWSLPACPNNRRRVGIIPEAAGHRMVMLCNDGGLFYGDERGRGRFWQTPFGQDAAGATTGVLLDDGRTFVLGTVRGVVGVWDLQKGALRTQTQTALGLISQLHVSKDGQLIAALGRGGSAALLRAATGRVVATLPGRDLRWARFLGDGRLVTLGGRYEIRRVDIDLPAAELVTGVGLAAAAPSPDGRRVAAAGGDGTLSVWTLPDGALAASFAPCSGVVKGLLWLSADALVAVCADPNPQRRIELTTGAVLPVAGSGSARRVVRLGDGVLSALYRGDFHFWSPEGEGAIAGCGPMVWAELDSNPAATLALAVTVSGQIGRVEAPDRCAVLEGLRADGAVAIDDAGTLYIGVANGLRALRDGQTRYELPHPGAPYELETSPDGRWLVAGALDGSVRVYEAPTGRLVALMREHRERVSSLSFSADGRTLFTASWDGTVRLHNLDALTASPGSIAARAAAWGIDPEQLMGEGATR